MLKTKSYRLDYRYKDDPACAYIAIDKRALEKMKVELDNDKNHKTFEIQEETVLGVLYCDDTLSIPGLDFLQGNAIRIGERHTDSRCSGMRSFYAMPEFEEQAKEQFNKESRGQEKSADSYYSKPWV